MAAAIWQEFSVHSYITLVAVEVDAFLDEAALYVMLAVRCKQYSSTSCSRYVVRSTGVRHARSTL